MPGRNAGELHLVLEVVDHDQPRLRLYLERDKNEDQTPGSTSTRAAAARRGLVPGRDARELHLVLEVVDHDQPRLHLYLERDKNEDQTPGSTSTRTAAARRGLVPRRDAENSASC